MPRPTDVFPTWLKRAFGGFNPQGQLQDPERIRTDSGIFLHREVGKVAAFAETELKVQDIGPVDPAGASSFDEAFWVLPGPIIVFSAMFWADQVASSLSNFEQAWLSVCNAAAMPAVAADAVEAILAHWDVADNVIDTSDIFGHNSEGSGTSHIYYGPPLPWYLTPKGSSTGLRSLALHGESTSGGSWGGNGYVRILYAEVEGGGVPFTP